MQDPWFPFVCDVGHGRNVGRVRHKEARGCVAPKLSIGIISYAASMRCSMHVHTHRHLTTIVCQF